MDKKKPLVASSVNIVDQLGRAQTIWAIISLALPPGLTAAAVWQAIRQNLPPAIIIEQAAVVFASCVLSVYFLYQLRNIITPAHKLRFLNTVVLRDLVEEPRKARRATATGAVTQRNLQRVQIGVQLQNISHFPISAILESAETEMEGHKPPRSSYPQLPTTILPGNHFFMVDAHIAMDEMPCGRLEGKMRLVVRYGDQGSEKYKLEFAGDVQVFMRQDGLIENIYTQWYSNQV